jgi:hypothetical protein
VVVVEVDVEVLVLVEVEVLLVVVLLVVVLLVVVLVLLVVGTMVVVVVVDVALVDVDIRVLAPTGGSVDGEVDRVGPAHPVATRIRAMTGSVTGRPPRRAKGIARWIIASVVRGAGGPAGHADDAQHQHAGEGLVPVLRVAPGQLGGQGGRPAGGAVALPAQLGPHPPQQ